MRIKPAYESEKAILGCLLLSPEMFMDAVRGVCGVDFFMPEHQEIFFAMSELYETHQCFDVHMLVDHLPETKDFENYLLMLANECCSTRNLKAHIDIIREKSVQRQLVEIAKELEEQTNDPEQAPEEIMDNVEKRVLAIKEKYKL